MDLDSPGNGAGRPYRPTSSVSSFSEFR